MLEMLVVITILTILTSISILAMKSLAGSTGLTRAGDQISGVFAFARQEAIAKDTMTATVLVTSPAAGNAAYRTVSVWELTTPTDGTAPSSSNWIQASKWQPLPTGIVVDNSAGATSFLSSTAVTPALPSINYLGTTLNPNTDCAVQVFLPSGRLSPPVAEPCTLKLVEGFYTGTTLTYQHPNTTTSQPANYVSYIFSSATGEPKIIRP